MDEPDYIVCSARDTSADCVIPYYLSFLEAHFSFDLILFYIFLQHLSVLPLTVFLRSVLGCMDEGRFQATNGKIEEMWIRRDASHQLSSYLVCPAASWPS